MQFGFPSGHKPTVNSVKELTVPASLCFLREVGEQQEVSPNQPGQSSCNHGAAPDSRLQW